MDAFRREEGRLEASKSEQSRIAYDRSRRGGMLAGIDQEPRVQECPQIAGGLRVPLPLLPDEFQEVVRRRRTCNGKAGTYSVGGRTGHVVCPVQSGHIAVRGSERRYDEAIRIEGTAFRDLDLRHGLGLPPRTEGRQYQPCDQGGAAAAGLRRSRRNARAENARRGARDLPLRFVRQRGLLGRPAPPPRSDPRREAGGRGSGPDAKEGSR